MVHDIDMVLEMVDSPIKNIQASGAKMMSSTIDLAHAHIQFQNGVVANLKSSRIAQGYVCLLYTSPSPRDKRQSRMPSSA